MTQELQQHNVVQRWHIPLIGIVPLSKGLIIDVKMLPDDIDLKEFAANWINTGKVIYKRSEEEEARYENWLHWFNESELSKFLPPALNEPKKQQTEYSDIVTELPPQPKLSKEDMEFWHVAMFGEDNKEPERPPYIEEY